MIKVLFFAQIRELIGVAELELPDADYTVQSLLAELSQRGDKWQLALSEKTVLCAVNQSLVEAEHPIRAGDEVAFFPPVTGG